MIPARRFFYLAATLALLALAVFHYRAELGRTALAALRDHLSSQGIDTLDLQGLQVSWGHIALREVHLGGVRDDLRFQLDLDAVSIGFDRAGLLAGRLGAVHVARGELDLTLAPARSGDAGRDIDLTAMLPGPYLARLPAASLAVDDFEVEIDGLLPEPVRARGGLAIAGGLQGTVQTRLWQTDFAAEFSAAQGRTAPVSITVEATAQAQSAAQLELQLLDAGDDTWSWALDGRANYAPLLSLLQRSGAVAATRHLPAETVVQGESSFDATLRHPAQLPAGALPSALIEAELRLQNRVAALHLPGLIQSLEGRADAELSADGTGIRVALSRIRLNGAADPALAALPATARDWLGWPAAVPVSLAVSRPAQLNYAGQAGWSLQLGDAAVTVGGGGSTLLLEDLALTGAELPAAPAIDLAARLQAHLRGERLPELSLSVRHRGPLADGTAVVAVADGTEALRLAVEGRGDFTSGAGQYRIDAAVNDLAAVAAAWLPPLDRLAVVDAGVTLTGGSINLQSRIAADSSAPQSWGQEALLDIAGVAGKFGEQSFEGLSVQGSWRGIDTVTTARPVQLTLDRFDAGFPVTAVRAQVSVPDPTPLQKPRLRIENFVAQVFGGQVLLPQAATWDFAAASNTLLLQAQDWQLEQLVALQQDDSISAQGVLEGALPVTLDDGRIVIEDGYLRAQAPGGTIRYTPGTANEALAAGSSELGLAMGLLRDFHYEVLRSSVGLDRAGILQLGLSLGGHNPAYQGGRRINFNINLEQNIDPLLQSLRLGDTLVRQIEGNFQ